MSALFNFHSFLTVLLLVTCTCTYLKMQFSSLLEQKTGFRGFFWKAARIGERLSPWVAARCFTMGVSVFLPSHFAANHLRQHCPVALAF